jgi:hypothetical protein
MHAVTGMKLPFNNRSIVVNSRFGVQSGEPVDAAPRIDDVGVVVRCGSITST